MSRAQCVELIEGVVQRTFVAARGRPGPARAVRRAAVGAAPDLERLLAGDPDVRPLISADVVDGRLVVRVSALEGEGAGD
jgi:hypothetical protein